MELERDVEGYLKRQVDVMGGLCWKFVSPGVSGVPDRIVIYKNMICFVELKTRKGRESKCQKVRRTQLNEHGMHAYVINSKDKVDELLIHIALGVYPDEI